VSQTWREKEIIVVDDGSSDDTFVSAKTLAAPGVQVVRQANAGASAARNHGLRLARGEYVQFLDADDLLAPDKLERQMATLREAGYNAVSSSAWGRFYTTPDRATFLREANWQDLSGVEFLQLHYETMAMMQPAAWLTPRVLIERAGPWNESISLNDDGEYFARVVLASSGIFFCENARSYYRSGTPGSLSRRKDARALVSLYRSVELTTLHLFEADQSPRTRAAIAYAWKWAAFELYPGAPDLSAKAEIKSADYGGSDRPFPGSGRFQLASRFFGWHFAKRYFS
jgi:glycosyltransferase involved in cell wall biosynthesis